METPGQGTGIPDAVEAKPIVPTHDVIVEMGEEEESAEAGAAD